MCILVGYIAKVKLHRHILSTINDVYCQAHVGNYSLHFEQLILSAIVDVMLFVHENMFWKSIDQYRNYKLVRK